MTYNTNNNSESNPNKHDLAGDQAQTSFLLGAEDSKNLDLLPMEWLEQAAECMRVLSHPARLRIIDILSQGKFTVGEIAEMCNLPANQACEHLRLLKSHRLLSSSRVGRAVYYQIESPQVLGLLGCVRKNCPDQLK